MWNATSKANNKRTPLSAQRSKSPGPAKTVLAFGTRVAEKPTPASVSRSRRSASPAKIENAYEVLSDYIDKFEREDTSLSSRILWDMEKEQLLPNVSLTQSTPSQSRTSSLLKTVDFFIQKIENDHQVRMHQLRQLKESMLLDLDWENEFNEEVMLGESKHQVVEDEEFARIMFGVEDEAEAGKELRQQTGPSSTILKSFDQIQESADWSKLHLSTSEAAHTQLLASFRDVIDSIGRRRTKESGQVQSGEQIRSTATVAAATDNKRRQNPEPATSTHLSSASGEEADEDDQEWFRPKKVEVSPPRHHRPVSRERGPAASSLPSHVDRADHDPSPPQPPPPPLSSAPEHEPAAVVSFTPVVVDKAASQSAESLPRRKPPPSRSSSRLRISDLRHPPPQSPPGLLLGISAIERNSDSEAESGPRSVDPVDSFLSLRRSLSFEPSDADDAAEKATQPAPRRSQSEDAIDLLTLAQEDIATFQVTSPTPRTPSHDPPFS